MDVGLVCDGCSAFNEIDSHQCESCSCALSLVDAEAPATDPVAEIPMPEIPKPALAEIPKPALAEIPKPALAEIPKPALAEEEAKTPDNVASKTSDSVNCGSCGAAVLSGNRFCGSCGTPVSPPKVVPVDPVVTAPAGGGGMGKKTLFFSTMQAAKAKLVLIKGEGNDGESYSLAGIDHLIGSDDADIVFEEDPFLSSTHANFFYVAGKLMVEDRNSTNGIYLRIRGTKPLQDNDYFLVGEQVIQVQLLEEPSPPTPYSDGTYFYSSPNPSAGFQLKQIMHGGATGLVFRASNETVTLGREENDINFPDDPFISGHHANVSIQNKALSLSDLGSKNGTFIRINQQTQLEHGDYVFMGQQLLRVEIV